MGINYKTLKMLNDMCGTLTDEEIKKRIKGYQEFAGSMKLSDDLKTMVKDYISYLSVDGIIRDEYENLIKQIKQTRKDFEYADSMYHMENNGQIIGLTSEMHAQTANHRAETKLKILYLVSKKEELEKRAPNLLLNPDMQILERISDDIITSLYFENLMKIKILKDELAKRNESKQTVCQK